MKIAIVGFGLEGQSTYQYFASQEGNEITVFDENPELSLPEGINSVLGENYLDNLESYDLIVRSAGIPPIKIIERNPGVKDKITSQLNIFLRVCPSFNIIGVTGTKGKGTTTTLIAKMLEAAGKQVVIGGNIGVPMLSLLRDISSSSYVVLELSSFQLIDLHEAAPRIAVCLMVAPEHLNWHSDLDEYASSKANLFSHQTQGDKAIYYAENEFSKQIASVSPGEHIPFFATPGAIVQNDSIVIDGQPITRVANIRLLGKHNLQNICAAVTAVWQVVKAPNAINYVLTTFTGLEHRLELVKEFDGVKYYEDSFGTTPETAKVAMESFEVPEVLIAGGSSKDSDYTPMIDAILENNVRHVICIGETGQQIANMLDARDNEHRVGITVLPINESLSMYDIVDAARSKAQAGDVVLLSPGSASFDMFKNYKDRGDQFKQAVQSLAPAS
jgi:UDP-N-acetylmuramoylalanine--D-glutamate ligase